MEGLLKHKFVYPRIEQKMTSTATISTIAIEPEVTTSTEVTEKEKFAKRFKPSNLKRNNQSNKQERSSSKRPIIRPLQADDIKEHRLWSLASLILCFCIIAPCVAFYHSRRIREMKKNQELTQAQALSHRVSSLLMFSSIVGIVIWVAIIFVIAVLFIMGAVY